MRGEEKLGNKLTNAFNETVSYHKKYRTICQLNEDINKLYSTIYMQYDPSNQKFQKQYII